MHILAKNMEPLVFAEFVKELSMSFKSKQKARKQQVEQDQAKLIAHV